MSKTLWTWCTGGTSSTVSPRSWSLHVHRNAHQPECKRSSVAHVNEEQIRKNHPKISKTLILPLYNIIYIYIYIYIRCIPIQKKPNIYRYCFLAFPRTCSDVTLADLPTATIGYCRGTWIACRMGWAGYCGNKWSWCPFWPRNCKVTLDC